MIVALPLKLFSTAETTPDPFCTTVSGFGVTVIEHGFAGGVGLDVGLGEVVGVEDGVAVGVGVGDD